VASAGPYANLHLADNHDNHASTAPLCFLQAGCPSCRPTNSVKALKALYFIITNEKNGYGNGSNSPHRHHYIQITPLDSPVGHKIQELDAILRSIFPVHLNSKM